MKSVFIPEVNYDELNKHYTISIKNLDVTAIGDSLETAASTLLDKLEFLAYTFFDDPETYIKTHNYQDYYDYFLGISNITKKEFLDMLGLVS